MIDAKTLGKQLATLRVNACVSQREMARRCGMSNSTVSRTEMGITDPSLLTLCAIAKALELDVIITFKARN